MTALKALFISLFLVLFASEGKSQCGIGQSYQIIAGLNMIVGDVMVSQDQDTLDIHIIMFPGWTIDKIDFDHYADSNDVPVSKKGKVIPGQLSVMRQFHPGVGTHTLRIPIKDMIVQDLYGALHMVVSQGGPTETAWASTWFGWFYYCVDGNSLPVTWVSIEIIDETLYWETAQEINNQGFWLQISLNGIDWSNWIFIEGQGTVFSNTKYQYKVPEITNTVVYIRLQQLDYDGIINYSKVLSYEYVLKPLNNNIYFNIIGQCIPLPDPILSGK